MSALWHKVIAVSVTAFAIAWACSLRARPDVSVVVRGFITNSCAPFPGDYVCAIIDVTNASRHTLICFHRNGQMQLPQAPKSYYPYLEGGFGSRKLSPCSGFCFETLVIRGTTNEVAVDIMQLRVAAWPFLHVPASIEQKLPEFLRTSVRQFTVTTTPFTVNGRLQWRHHSTTQH